MNVVPTQLNLQINMAIYFNKHKQCYKRHSLIWYSERVINLYINSIQTLRIEPNYMDSKHKRFKGHLTHLRILLDFISSFYCKHLYTLVWLCDNIKQMVFTHFSCLLLTPNLKRWKYLLKMKELVGSDIRNTLYIIRTKNGSG